MEAYIEIGIPNGASENVTSMLLERLSQSRPGYQIRTCESPTAEYLSMSVNPKMSDVAVTHPHKEPLVVPFAAGIQQEILKILSDIQKPSE